MHGPCIIVDKCLGIGFAFNHIICRGLFYIVMHYIALSCITLKYIELPLHSTALHCYLQWCDCAQMVNGPQMPAAPAVSLSVHCAKMIKMRRRRRSK